MDSKPYCTLLKKVWDKCVYLTQTQIEIQKALKEDPTVYEYDAVYDKMEENKKAANVKDPEKDRKVTVAIWNVRTSSFVSSVEAETQLFFLLAGFQANLGVAVLG